MGGSGQKCCSCQFRGTPAEECLAVLVRAKAADSGANVGWRMTCAFVPWKAKALTPQAYAPELTAEEAGACWRGADQPPESWAMEADT